MRVELPKVVVPVVDGVTGVRVGERTIPTVVEVDATLIASNGARLRQSWRVATADPQLTEDEVLERNLRESAAAYERQVLAQPVVATADAPDASVTELPLGEEVEVEP